MEGEDYVTHYGLATPPQEPQDSKPLPPGSSGVLGTALHVLSTEARALACLEAMYRTDEAAQTAFSDSVNLVASTVANGGKTVVCGIGKSGKIAQKFVATMNSLSMTAVFLHAAEAIHGDLGVIRDGDAVIFISFSGKSPELLSLLPHMPSTVPSIVLTGQTSSSQLCVAGRSILLPAPIHESEEESFDVCAPTTSTTVALALCDALAVSTAQFIHDTGGKTPKDIFARNHPGGAIGQKNLSQKAT